MKKRRYIIGILCAAAAAFCFGGCGGKKAEQQAGSAEQAGKEAEAEDKEVKEFSGNPIITSFFTADPSAHVWEDGRIYIYASHDIDPSRGCDFMDRYHVFSSDDMVNWIDEGEILSAADNTWGREEGGFMWAPDCAYKDGTYYFYYPHPSETDWQSSWKIGVAVSKDPKKDFTDIGYIEGLGGNAMIDPCVFIDDDGTAYMYYGGGGKCQGGILNEDMISMKTEAVDMEGLFDFHEGAWVFKRNGIYYLVYPDGTMPAGNKMLYAVSGSPLGPWTYQGVVLDSTGCETSHGSVVEYKGNWYLFYHNQALSNNGTLRSVAVDLLEFTADNQIKMVEQTRTGVPNVGDGISAYTYQFTYSTDAAVLSDSLTLRQKQDGSGSFVTIQEAGDVVRFENVDGGNGKRANIQVSYASGNFNLAKVRLFVNGVDYSLLNAYRTANNWFTFTGMTGITVEVEPGAVNTIEIHGYGSGLNIDGIAVAPMD